MFTCIAEGVCKTSILLGCCGRLMHRQRRWYVYKYLKILVIFWPHLLTWVSKTFWSNMSFWAWRTPESFRQSWNTFITSGEVNSFFNPPEKNEFPFRIYSSSKGSHRSSTSEFTTTSTFEKNGSMRKSFGKVWLAQCWGRTVVWHLLPGLPIVQRLNFPS